MKTNSTFPIALATLVHHRGLPLRDSDPGGGPVSTQERACTSPIWYTP